MFKKISLATAVMGATLGSLALPTSAATLVSVSPLEAADWTNLGWAVEGRAGAPGFRDYEYAIGPNGAQADNTGQIYRDWVTSGADIAWSLVWDGVTAAFTLGGQTISHAPVGALSNIFEGFYLQTKARTITGEVAPGTSMFLSVTDVNGTSIDPVSSISVAPESGQDLDTFFFESDTPITSLSGIARMTWDTINPNQTDAQGLVTFKLRGFDTAARSPEDVPEPTSVLAFGVLGLSWLLQKKARA